MTKNLFEPTEGVVDALLAKAWEMAKLKYPDGHDAESFMENPQKATLGTQGTDHELSSPIVLITKEGQRGFNIVQRALIKG